MGLVTPTGMLSMRTISAVFRNSSNSAARPSHTFELAESAAAWASATPPVPQRTTIAVPNDSQNLDIAGPPLAFGLLRRIL